MNKKGLYEKFFKRPFDLVFSLILFTLLSPLIIFIGILVLFINGRPIIFKQNRPGLNEKIFKLYKFRTMNNKKDTKGHLLADELRLTKFGKFLRSTSLDELPSLINIIKGDLSFVGPRPLAVQYLPYYTYEENKRHSIRPGLTGLAQVNGRNLLSWEDRFSYDILYCKSITFIGDMIILFKTFFTVLKRRNIGLRGIGNLQDFDLYRKRENKNGNK
jgi:undecaprenyl phosphate N,N'-diacetylbacillosamine 1-phosphate transferase